MYIVESLHVYIHEITCVQTWTLNSEQTTESISIKFKQHIV
jgi:hypothetical protein